MTERETFADKVGKNIDGFEGDPETIQIPYWLAAAIRIVQGDKTSEEYILDAIEFKIGFDNLSRITDVRLVENCLKRYRGKRDEQKADSGNTGQSSENQNRDNGGDCGTDERAV